MKCFTKNWLYGLSLLFWLAALPVQAELVLKAFPEVVPPGGTARLEVSGAVGTLTWSPPDRIEGAGVVVDYTAPMTEGIYTVFVRAENGATASVQVIVSSELIKLDYSPGNATWKMYTYRNAINVLAYSLERSRLWVGSNGGLEEREAHGGDLAKVYTRIDGLPDQMITALLPDEADGLWVGTDNGLAYRNAEGLWRSYTEADGLPDTQISALALDGNDGIWIGTIWGGLAHRDANGVWTPYDVPGDWVSALAADGQGGVWIGTSAGLEHRDADGVLTSSNMYDAAAGSAIGFVNDLLMDDAQGLWAATDNGLAHRDGSGNWQVYGVANGLPSGPIMHLAFDADSGLWLSGPQGTARQTASASWTVLGGLPQQTITALLADQDEGLWLGAEGLARWSKEGQ